MKFVMPLKIKSIDSSLSLPIDLVDTVSIEKFDLHDKEQFFGVEKLVITKDQCTFKNSNDFPEWIHGHDQLLDYLHGNYCVVISVNEDNPTTLQHIQKICDFAFKVVLGCGFSVVKIIDTSTPFNNSVSSQAQPVISRRKINTMRLAEVERLIALIPRIQQDKKTSLLKFLLDTAMEQVPNLGISGALYVAILESIFVPEAGETIKYKLAMRISRMKAESICYSDKIKKFYDRRSRVFHGSVHGGVSQGGEKNVFSIDELKFLEEEACWAIEKYLLKPDDFTQEALDRNLLTCNACTLKNTNKQRLCG